MSILSFEFICFVIITVALHYALPVKARWVLLLTASLGFYAFAGWQGLLYLLCATAVTYGGALWLSRLRAQEKAALAQEDKAQAYRQKKKRAAVQALTLLLIVGAMGFIKYFDAGRGMLNALFSALALRSEIPALSLLVPLGLSYFTFQSAGYVIDVARGKVQAEKNPFKYLLFVSFFPQITQGPIDSYKRLAPQLMNPRRFEAEPFVMGFQLTLWGYFKKLVLADRLSPVTEEIAKAADQPGWLILLGVILYAIRLYADFSGGMDVIRGVAKMLGIEVAENFKRPFFSLSVSEYWRRWHISLGVWFRSYVFYPITTSHFGLSLGKAGKKLLGKKSGRALPGAFATVVIFLLIGIWHTANWNAVIYGAYFGFVMAAAMLLEPVFKWIKGKLHISDKTLLWRGFCLIRTWALVLLAQYFAFTAGPGKAFSLLAGTVKNWQFQKAAGSLTTLMEPLEWGIAGAALLIVLLIDILCERGVDVNKRLARAFFPVRWAALILLIVAILVFGCYGAGFDQAAFLYTQF